MMKVLDNLLMFINFTSPTRGLNYLKWGCAFTQWLPWNNSYLLYHRLDKKASLSDTSWLPVMSLFILGLKEKNICFIKQDFVVIFHLLRNFFNLIGWGKTYLNLIDLTDRIEQKLARKITFLITYVVFTPITDNIQSHASVLTRLPKHCHVL